MKRTLLTILLAGILAASCQHGKPASTAQSEATQDNPTTETDETAEAAETPAEAPVEISMTGSINPDTWTPEEKATVTLSHIPTTVDAFRQLQSQIGGTPQGAVALQLVAFEMYNQQTEVGTECVKLNNTETNVPSVMRRLPDIFGKNSLDDSYPRRHLVATFFDGATPENGFNPTRPYTITVRSSKVHDYQRAESLKGYVLYLEVYSTGYDTHWRGCEVVKQKGHEYYTVSNSPSMYVQCKEVPFDASEDYKGLQ